MHMVKKAFHGECSFLEMHKTPSILQVLKSPTQCFSNLFKPWPVFLANLSILCKTILWNTLGSANLYAYLFTEL